MEGKKLNLNAPILSVRRISTNNKFRTKNVGNSEFNIPITRERKTGKTKNQNIVRIEENDFDNESLFNCSASDSSESSSSEPWSNSSPKKEYEDFMMDRFMTAAKAMTSPQEDIPSYRHKHRNDEELESYIDEDDDEYGDESPLIYLNPIRGIKAQDDLLLRFHIEVSHHRSLAQAHEPQDEVYKHKFGLEGTYVEENKPTSESNHSPIDEKGRDHYVPKRNLFGRMDCGFDLSEKTWKKHGEVISLSPSIKRCTPNLNPLDKFVDAATETSSTSSTDQSKFEGKSKFEDLKKYGCSSLLSLPLPQSPSESWLKRTLPVVSVSNLHHHQSRFYGPEDPERIRAVLLRTKRDRLKSLPNHP